MSGTPSADLFDLLAIDSSFATFALVFAAIALLLFELEFVLASSPLLEPLKQAEIDKAANSETPAAINLKQFLYLQMFIYFLPN